MRYATELVKGPGGALSARNINRDLQIPHQVCVAPSGGIAVIPGQTGLASPLNSGGGGGR